MQIAQILSGYSLGEADLLRRAMGKKKPAEMAKQRVRFQEGAQKHGLTRERADFIFDLVAEFAGYGFNKSHAAAYALIAYRTGWLKANHPVAFMAALMSLDRTNTDKLAIFFQETRRMGLEVLPPDVNASEADFSVEDGKVRYALGAIRNVGFSAMEHVAAVRAEGGPFRDLYDFAERVDPRLVNKRAFENLARSGAFDGLEPDRARALAAAETLLGMAQKAHQERESAQVSLFGGPGQGEGAGLARPHLPEVEPWDPVRRLDEELAAVGFYLSGHPLDDMGPSLARRGVVLFADMAARVADGRSAARMAAVVRRKQEKVSRRSGEKFAFVTLSDPSGEFEALAPPKVLREVRDVLEPGGAVLLNVRIEEQDEGLRLIVDGADVLDPNAAEHNGAGVRIHLDDPASLEPLKSRIERADGREGARGGLHLVMPLGDGRFAELRLPGRHAIDPAARAAFKAVSGVSDVEQL
jgi:DNA polymerase-3 subunit alpha